jgi:hypothetical protein
MLKAIALAVALASAAQAHAETKKELVQKLLVLQQPGIEAAGKQLAEQPAAALMQRAGIAMQAGLPADKREAVARDIQSDVKKYADEAVPLLRKRAVELAPGTLGPLYEQHFNDDELKQLVTFLESPVYRKYQQLGAEMQRTLAEKLVADTRPTVEPKLRALEQQIAQRLQTAQRGTAASAPASAPAPSPAASHK